MAKSPYAQSVETNAPARFADPSEVEKAIKLRKAQARQNALNIDTDPTGRGNIGGFMGGVYNQGTYAPALGKVIGNAIDAYKQDQSDAQEQKQANEAYHQWEQSKPDPNDTEATRRWVANGSQYTARNAIEREFAKYDEANKRADANYTRDRTDTVSDRDTGWKHDAEVKTGDRTYQTNERVAGEGFRTGERVAGQDYQSGENVLNRNQQSSLQANSQRYQSGENRLNRANSLEAANIRANNSSTVAKLPAAAQKTFAAQQNLTSSLDNYKTVLGDYNPQSAAAVTPTQRAKVAAAFTDLQMRLKEGFELGAITGPDMSILQNAITDPTSMRGTAAGAAFGKDYFDEQLTQAQGAVARSKANFTKQYGVEFPEAAKTPPANTGGASGSWGNEPTKTYDAARSGELYTAPDGSTRRRK